MRPARLWDYDNCVTLPYPNVFGGELLRAVVRAAAEMPDALDEVRVGSERIRKIDVVRGGELVKVDSATRRRVIFFLSPDLPKEVEEFLVKAARRALIPRLRGETAPRR